MAEREVVLDQPELFDDQAEALRKVTERAEHAEAELAKLKNAAAHKPAPAAQHPVAHAAAPSAAHAAPQPSDDAALKSPPSPSTREARDHAKEDVERAPEPADADDSDPSVENEPEDKFSRGEEELRKDSMMAYLLDSLNEGKDIGHYGRLVFAMVARHFMPHEEVIGWMTRDKDVDEEKANLMLRQVEGKDYNPPRRDKILSYQAQQDFPILPFPDDPDCGNLYRNLKFPNEIYQHIGHYQEAKTESGH